MFVAVAKLTFAFVKTKAVAAGFILTFRFSLFCTVRSSTPSLIKTEKRETEYSPQRTPSSPKDEVFLEKPREETARAFNPVNTR